MNPTNFMIGRLKCQRNGDYKQEQTREIITCFSQQSENTPPRNPFNVKR